MEKVTSLNPEATPHCVWSSLCERPALPSACFVDHLQAQCQAQASRKDLSQLMVPVGLEIATSLGCSVGQYRVNEAEWLSQKFPRSTIFLL